MNCEHDFLNQIRTIAANVQVPKRRLDFNRFAIGMAKRGYVFTEETMAFARTYCDGGSLCIRGDVGTGKSFFFYCAGVPALSVELAQGMPIEKINRALESWRDTDILIDDIGKENADYKSYGTSLGLVDYIIERRLDTCARTHFTTNRTPQELENRYGTRIVDRLTQLCTVVVLNGQSRRNPDSQRMNSWYSDFFRGRIWKACDRCCRNYDSDERKCIKGKEVEPRIDSDGEPICPYF